MKTVCFVPVYDQIEELPLVLDELARTDLPCEILMVNNGSTDGSEVMAREAAEECGYHFIDIPENKGLGWAQIVCIDWALEHGFDVFTGIASNGKMLPSELPRVLAPVLEDRADFVTGSRYLEGGASPNLPLFRRVTIRCMNLLIKAIVGASLTDSTCGYRAMRLDLFRRARFDWHRSWLYTYEFEYYIYAKVILNGLRWQEVPVTMRYPEKGRRYTKIRPVVDWWRMIKPWIRARLERQGFAPATDEVVRP